MNTQPEQLANQVGLSANVLAPLATEEHDATVCKPVIENYDKLVEVSQGAVVDFFIMTVQSIAYASAQVSTRQGPKTAHIYEQKFHKVSTPMKVVKVI